MIISVLFLSFQTSESKLNESVFELFVFESFILFFSPTAVGVQCFQHFKALILVQVHNSSFAVNYSS